MHSKTSSDSRKTANSAMNKMLFTLRKWKRKKLDCNGSLQVTLIQAMISECSKLRRIKYSYNFLWKRGTYEGFIFCFWLGKKDKKLNTTALKDFYFVAVVVILFYWFVTAKSRETRAAKPQHQVASRGGKNWVGISLKNTGRCVYHSRVL